MKGESSEKYAAPSPDERIQGLGNYLQVPEVFDQKLQQEAERVSAALENSTTADAILFPTKSRINADAQEAFKSFERVTELAERGKIRSAAGLQPDRQKSFDFSKVRLAHALQKILQMSPGDFEKPLIVFAGYTGEFTQALAKEGLSVLHSDADAKYAHVEGVRSQKALAHNLPTVPDALAYASFEGYPALQGSHGFLTILKAMAETEKGMVIMQSGKIFVRDFIQPMYAFAHAYNAKIRIYAPTREDCTFSALVPTPEVREKAAFDLRVLERLQAGQMHIPSIARQFDSTAKDVRRSLLRIHMSFLHGSPYLPPETQ